MTKSGGTVACSGSGVTERFPRFERSDGGAHTADVTPGGLDIPTYAEPVLDMPVTVVEYDPHWPSQFAKQRDQLAHLLGPWLAAPVEHVGSTSVPGLAAKPVIDILAPVIAQAEARGAVSVLENDGWLYWPADPNGCWRLWFLRPRPEARTHHLYLIQRDDPHVAELRAFRDALRANRGLRDQYGALKRRLANVFRDDREAYTRAKAHFIDRTLRAGGVDPLPRPPSE